jgi:hypothetical protein
MGVDSSMPGKRGVRWSVVNLWTLPKPLFQKFEKVLSLYWKSRGQDTQEFTTTREELYEAVSAAIAKSQGIDLTRKKISVVFRAPRIDFCVTDIKVASKKKATEPVNLF